MNKFIDIVDVELTQDDEGFSTSGDVVVASVRAYQENRHGTKTWANRAAFSTATCLFRFRYIPNVEITTKQKILCEGKRYIILSAENIRSRNMWIECLCSIMEVSKGG
jgi:head-tail adaptor